MQPDQVEIWAQKILDDYALQGKESGQSSKRNYDSVDLSGPLMSPMPSPSPKRRATKPPDLESTPQSLDDVKHHEFLRRRLSYRPSPSRESSPSPSKRQRASTSKRYMTTASLKQLDPPIYVVNPLDLESELPADIQPLYNELYMAIKQQGILPRNLERIMDAEDRRRAKVLSFMWQGSGDQEQDEWFRQQHRNVLEILAEAAEASTMTKGESAWNAQVHYPILKLALSSIPSTRAETIANAQIIKTFRPKSQGQGWSSASSSATSSNASILSDDTGTYTEPESSSVHNLVDFALVLMPNNALEDKITRFFANQEYPTVNQTLYDALSRRPAPVFIETKTSAGVINRSHVQLGIWTAAWYQRLRAVKSTKDPIAIPVIQVHGDVWTVMFAKDDKNKISLLDQSIRIGDTATLLYLRAMFIEWNVDCVIDCSIQSEAARKPRWGLPQFGQLVSAPRGHGSLSQKAQLFSINPSSLLRVFARHVALVQANDEPSLPMTVNGKALRQHYDMSCVENELRQTSAPPLRAAGSFLAKADREPHGL
ncbi:uncharacterized protein FMAN_14160 [Fusarium mangiferae]|uniref:PD-(D/E)XK nuclease-like domain-containing protein n=1 Tax=Fusarium mangiferae TaxID=192010 RepID=A0A1L7UBU8_FUSMA|nr:uncharacterized protein FMAN_14160 [Fusarium mangiferae]CVL08198.1 uncharacterized protein FMAN_14160 [Fusarium mangiferae]